MGKRVYGAFLTQIDGVPEAEKDTDERGKTQRKNASFFRLETIETTCTNENANAPYSHKG